MEINVSIIKTERAFSYWPWEEEDISLTEYRRSLEGLKRFVEVVEVDHLHTLEDLSAIASLVGHDIAVLAVAYGKKYEKKTEEFEPTVREPICRVERKYVFIRTVDRQEIVVTARKGYCLISWNRLCGFHRWPSEELSLRLPTDRDIAIGEKPNVDEQSLYAKDLRRDENKVYHPTKEPMRSEIQQSFARLLQDVLREIIAELPIIE